MALILQDDRTRRHWGLPSPNLAKPRALGLPGDLSGFSTPTGAASARRPQGPPAGHSSIEGFRGRSSDQGPSSVLLSRKLARVSGPGQCLSQHQWDSVPNLHPQLPSLISSVSLSPGDISSLHRACHQLNPRPDGGGGDSIHPQPHQLLRAAGLPGAGPVPQSHFLLPTFQVEVPMALSIVACSRDGLLGEVPTFWASTWGGPWAVQPYKSKDG